MRYSKSRNQVGLKTQPLSPGILWIMLIPTAFILFWTYCLALGNFKDNVRFGDINRVRLNILFGQDLNEDLDGKPAIDHAGYMNHFDIVDMLVEAGANVNLQDKDGNTVLMWAAGYNKPHTVTLLFQHGANVNVRDYNGRTALMWAAEYSRPTNIATSLLSHGADVNVQAKNGETALMLAIKRSNLDMVELLLRHGADTHLRDKSGKTALMVAKSWVRWNPPIISLLNKK